MSAEESHFPPPAGSGCGAALAVCGKCGGSIEDTPLGRACPRCLFDVGVADVPANAGARTFGEFELLEELGRGGMGVVYRAWQPRLQRTVALKLLLAGAFAAPANAGRFRREALAAARLAHAGLASIYDAGEADGQPFLVMELVEGRSLAEVLADGLPPPSRAADWLAQAAEAVAHAHAHGVLHRDLKPSNLILAAGETIKVADFGLALLTGETPAAALTVSTAVLGSPPYMAPEQAAGAVCGEAADVYALGAVLYECLTGRPPHRGSSPAETLRHVREETPVEPRRLNPGAPRDLENVCLKCLERDPLKRYRSAGDLAGELGRFLRGEPVQARPVRWPGRLARWCRRRPALAALAAVTLLALAVTVAVLVHSAERMREAAEDARQAAAESRSRLRESLISQARAAVLTRDAGRRIRSLESLRQAAAIAETPEAAELALAALALPDFSMATDWPGTPDGYARPSPRGDAWSFLTREGTTCRLTVHAMPDGGSLRECGGLPPCRPEARARLSEDLAYAGYAGEDGQVRIVRTVDGAVVVCSPGRDVATFSKDGRHVFVVVEETGGWNRLEKWETGTGGRAASWSAPRIGRLQYTPLHLAVPSPDGRLLAVARPALDGAMVLDADSGAIIFQKAAVGRREMTSMAWHPERSVLAVAGQQAVTTIDVTTGQELSRWSAMERGTVLGMAFSPDGRWLATSGWGGATDLYDWENGRLEMTAAQACGAEAFSADGRWLVGSRQNGVLVWKMLWPRGWRTVGQTVAWPDRWEPLQTTDFDGTGQWLAVADGAGVQWCSADGRRRLARIAVGPVNALGFHPVRNELTVATECGLLRVPWRRSGSTLELGPVEALWPAGSSGFFQWTGDGSRLAVWTQSAGGRVLHVLTAGESGASLRETAAAEPVDGGPRGPRWSPDGRWLADHVWFRGYALVWDAGTGALVEESSAAMSYSGPLWTPEGHLWAPHPRGGSLIEPETWKRLRRWEWPARQEAPSAAVFLKSAPGRLIRGNGAGGLVMASWPEDVPLIQLRPPSGGSVLSLRAHPRDRRVAVTSSDGRTSLWDIDDGAAAMREGGFFWPEPVVDKDRSGALAVPQNVAIRENDDAISAAREQTRGSTPARDAATPAACLDLTAHYNRMLNAALPWDGPLGLGGAGFSGGLFETGGLRFDARGLIMLNGGAIPRWQTDLPVVVDAIPVGRKASRIHFLLGSVTDTPAGTVAGGISFRLSRGHRAVMPLTSGETLGGSLIAGNAVPILSGAARVAWQARTADGRKVVLYAVTWANPQPAQTVEALSIRSTMEPGTPFVLGITVED